MDTTPYSRISVSTINGLAYIFDSLDGHPNQAELQFVVTALANGLEYQAAWAQSGGRRTPEEQINTPPYLPEL